MIVKVQTPISTNIAPPQVLAYNKDRSVWVTFDLTDEMDTRVGPKKKAFFYARIDKGQIELLDEAPWQDW